MKKYRIILFLFMLTGLILSPVQGQAFSHGYESRTDYIYALARNELPVYVSDYSYDMKTVLPKYTGVTVIGSSGSWYEIQYRVKKKGIQYGWVTKEEFNSDCLIYDGSEKQPFSNGKYQVVFYTGTGSADDSSSGDTEEITAVKTVAAVTDTTAANLSTAGTLCVSSMLSSLSSLTRPVSYHSPSTFYFEYTGDGLYRISDSAKEKYLLAGSSDPSDIDGNTGISEESTALWGSKAEAGEFRITRKGSYYKIFDVTSGTYLRESTGGILTFTKSPNALWRLTRTKKAVETKNLHLFAQYDPLWGKHHYGNEASGDTDTNNFCTSGCGIFATVNAIYALSGHFADPYELADYASDKHYRIEDCGTDSDFFKAAALKFGSKYGFAYDGSGESISELKKKLKAGDTAIVYLPGHYGAIVDYNAKKDKFLLLDPHYLPKRQTSPYGDWISRKDLEDGNLMSQMFFYYKAIP